MFAQPGANARRTLEQRQRLERRAVPVQVDVHDRDGLARVDECGQDLDRVLDGDLEARCGGDCGAAGAGVSTHRQRKR